MPMDIARCDIRRLREIASAMGVSARGSHVELVKRVQHKQQENQRKKMQVGGLVLCVCPRGV
jgi:hypothetical protein